jgi:hypothetical protein
MHRGGNKGVEAGLSHPLRSFEQLVKTKHQRHPIQRPVGNGV